MQNNIWQLKEAEKICSIDLDGICNYYPDTWIDFVNKELKTNFIDLNYLKTQVSYDTYKKLKEKYRLSGIKENLKANPDAVHLTNKLKEQGWTIIIITARPAQEYPTLAKQTHNWLDKNGFAYDYVLFGEKYKHIRVLEHFQNLKFAVDDNSYICNQMAKWGYKTFLLNGKQNEGLITRKDVIRINDLREILYKI